MKIWLKYRNRVYGTCTKPFYASRNLTYLQDHLFAGIVCYLLPFSLIALLPGVYMSYVMGVHLLGIADLFVFTGIVVVACAPGISLLTRKAIFILCLYLLACVLLYFLGLYGPGLVYLLATCVFSVLIFPTAIRYWPAWANGFICLVFIIAANQSKIPGFVDRYNSMGAGVAVTSNLVFLSFLSSALIPQLFNGLQETIEQDMNIKKTLHDQQESLTDALDRLQQKNIELEQFAYVASHDLKEPVRMVISFMGMLQRKYQHALDEKAHAYIKLALDAGRRMQKMIDDLLEFSRTAHPDMVKEHVHLKQLLEEVQLNIATLMEEKHVVIHIKDNLPVLFVYRSDMIRLLQNLLTNAIKFSPEEKNPVVQIGASEKENHWMISVEDNGIGIQDDQFDKIFEIFGRLHPREIYDGTGIGLAICKKVVEQHGGTIWVESQEGEGSIFYFEILK